MTNRINDLEHILDYQISVLKEKVYEDSIPLNDSKQLTELLKATQLLDLVKRSEGEKSIYDTMSSEDLEKALITDE